MFSESSSLRLQLNLYQTLSLKSNFLHNILDPYKQIGKVQEKFYWTKILKENVTCSIDNVKLICNNFKKKLKKKLVERNYKTLCGKNF